uniref:Fibrinopeptide A n=1 Tax=Heligmosomoides polygyrus TaxID=6339 RepID=A0A183F9Q5_HELPZ
LDCDSAITSRMLDGPGPKSCRGGISIGNNKEAGAGHDDIAIT